MIVVVGSGIAGVAAALTTRAEGEDVTLVRGAAGATVLAPGTIDDAPWQQDGSLASLDAQETHVLDALGIHRIGNERAKVATTSGIVRPARGIDRALLDLARVRGLVVIPAIEREGWDARALARCLSEHGIESEARAAQLILQTDDRVVPDADLAAKNDDAARLATFAERLREIATGASAILLPPWLGIEAPRAEALSQLVGVACGEIAASPGSSAGMRFMRARDRALEKAGIAIVSGFATRIEHRDGCILHIKDGEPLRARAIVVATGGLVGGGIAYTPSDSLLATALPRVPRPPFALSIEGAGTIGHRGEPVLVPGSLFGVQPEMLAWPFSDAMERVGIIACEPDVHAAGDVLADRDRTFLAALRSGVHAAHEALKSRVPDKSRAAS